MAQVPGDERVVHRVVDKADAFSAPSCLATRLRDIGKSSCRTRNTFSRFCADERDHGTVPAATPSKRERSSERRAIAW